MVGLIVLGEAGAVCALTTCVAPNVENARANKTSDLRPILVFPSTAPVEPVMPQFLAARG